METKEFQILFNKKIYSDSIIQLKDGKILLYTFHPYCNIYILNEKTFQKLYEINLLELVKKYEEENKNNDNLNNKEYKYDDEEDYYHYEDTVKIKEKNDGLILIGFNKYLIELKINKQAYDCKIVKKINDSILELNILKYNRIIIITKKNIFILNKINKEYIIKNEYIFKDDWKSVTEDNYYHYYGQYNEYISSYLLPKNRLLLKSFSKGECKRKCGLEPIETFSVSKITFINLASFEKIISTKILDQRAEFIVLKKNIIFQIGCYFTIYDINSLKVINKINLPNVYGDIEKLYDDNLIAFSDNDKGEKIMIIYKIENNDLIEKFKVKGNLIVKTGEVGTYNKIKLYNYSYLLALKDKRIIIYSGNRLFIIKINCI